MGTVRRIGAVLAGVAMLATGTLGPAAAEVEMMYDAAGDSTAAGGYGDIRTVRVKHGPERLKVTVGHGRHGQVTDVILVWIDTDPGRRGPELLAGAAAEVEPQASIRVADGWDREARTEVRCPGQVTARWWFNGDPERVKLVIPRQCLGSADRVRISVASEPDHPYERVDWAPGKERFGPWVTSG